MSFDSWICPACTLRQPASGLCIFCGAPSPEATSVEESPFFGLVDSNEPVNQDILKKRRQFITSKIRTEFPHLNEEGFDAELIRSARKKARFFVFGESTHANLNSYEKSVLLQDCLDDLFGFGPLGPLVRDPEIREIRVFSKDLTRARKKNRDFEDALVRFDDERHLDKLIDIIRGRSSPMSWKNPEQGPFDHYVTWDGIKIAVAHHPVPKDQPYMTFLFQDPLGAQTAEAEAGQSNVKPLENHAAIRQRRQFVCSQIKKEFPKWNPESFEKVRKKIRQLVFGDSSGSRLTPYEKTVLYQDCLDEIFGFGVLGPLMRDPEITEIRVYSPERTTVKRRDLFETMSVMFDDESHLRRIVNLLVSQSQPRDSDDRNIDEYVTPTGSRIVVNRSPANSEEPFLHIVVPASVY